MKKQHIRPYVKTTVKIQNFVDENASEAVRKMMHLLANFLKSQCIHRPARIKKKTDTEIKKDEIDSLSGNKNTLLTFLNNLFEAKASTSNDISTIGLRSVLRHLNKLSTDEELRLKEIFLDAALIKPTAVSQIISLIAIGHSSGQVSLFIRTRFTIDVEHI